ncbi:DUF3429 domain-containing protein [Aliiglaciecola litoralis]|uniref:DUF3429 domain-containing protein n=1 Tax=Aliiglaciecola litoralis TaxID=582857 RepID=A0ABN1LLM7_9ALTE
MLNYHSRILGYAGLIPFIALPFYILWGNVSYFEGISYFTQYSAIILSFLGGILWHEGISQNKPVKQLYWSMLPSLIGWLCLIIVPPFAALIVLSIAFLLILVFELRTLDSPSWYISLRVRLTAVTIGGHLMMIWLVLQNR